MSPSRYTLGINTSFAVKRWPEPEQWAFLIEGLGLNLVQHTFDLVDLDGPPEYIKAQAGSVRSACGSRGLRLHSTFTGLAAYSSNLLLHPDELVRERAEDWYRRAIDFSAWAGAASTGGHLGAFSISDWQDQTRRESLTTGLERTLRRLTEHAKRRGLRSLLVENMAAAREPSTMEWMTTLIAPGDGVGVPVTLCLDVGHQCVPGTAGAERDPYEWLRRLGSAAEVVHLQQTDANADHHWAFTEETAVVGRIRADEVLAALEASGVKEVALVLEVVPAFEADDDTVMRDITTSIDYWRQALDRHSQRI
jgi:D-erythrulose 1-phosphate 3-epimerase